MRFYFHEAAAEEIEKAADYYEQLRPGLGLEFAREVYAAIERIIQFPDAWSPLSRNTRRCLLNRFPFGIIYQVKSGLIRIIAVAIFEDGRTIGMAGHKTTEKMINKKCRTICIPGEKKEAQGIIRPSGCRSAA